MCLLERRIKDNINSFNNMTLTTSYITHNACIDVGLPPDSRSSIVGCCVNCRQDVQIKVSRYCGCRSPVSPQPALSPLCTPKYKFYSPWKFHYNTDYTTISDTIRALKLSGWYYENSMDWQGAITLLKEASVGAFLLRNSADKNYLFSLSVQTEKGPTSVRLHYECGYFRLDCEKALAKYMPRFRGIVELIQHYTREGSQKPRADTMWVDQKGCPHSKVVLKSPVRRSPPSLRHSARLAIHRALDSNPLTPKLWNAPKHRLLPLPTILLQYLDEYPYTV